MILLQITVNSARFNHLFNIGSFLVVSLYIVTLKNYCGSFLVVSLYIVPLENYCGSNISVYVKVGLYIWLYNVRKYLFEMTGNEV